MKKEDLKKWANTKQILLPPEMPREEFFLDLFRQCLESTMVGTSPSPTEIISARAQAAYVWQFDRETGNGEILLERVLNTDSYNLSRHNAFREADERTRMQSIFFKGAQQARALATHFRVAARLEAPKVETLTSDKVVSLNEALKKRAKSN